MSVQQLSVFVENKRGGLAEVTHALAQNRINILALSIADTTDYGVLRIIVDRPEEAAEILKMQNAAVTLTDVLAVKMPNYPGGLDGAVQALSAENFSIEYMYAFVCPLPEEACMVFRVEERDRAGKVLEDAGYTQLVTSDLYERK